MVNLKLKHFYLNKKLLTLKKTGKQLQASQLEEKQKNLQIGGQETFKMLAPNWEDHSLETNPIINYFSDRNHTEMS